MIAPVSQPSLKNMRDGEESESMLLALLWSPTMTLVERGNALLATANYKGDQAVVIILVGTQLTEHGLQVVGTANKDENENKA